MNLGSTALYVYGPGNESFDAYPLNTVSHGQPYVFCSFQLLFLNFGRLVKEVLSWPRYLFEVQASVQPPSQQGILQLD